MQDILGLPPKPYGDPFDDSEEVHYCTLKELQTKTMNPLKKINNYHVI